MKIKMIYQIGAFYYEAECVNEQERKEAIKGLLYATKDLGDNGLLGTPQTWQNEPPMAQTEASYEEPKPAEEPASESQKAYMWKLGIQFPENITKIQAIDLINEYKVANGIPIRKKKI